ncbi:MAG: hypothetical protein D6814_06100, partial [Calditrichaeota bacterium]
GFSPGARAALPLFWIDSIASSDGINFKAINPGLQPGGPGGSPSFFLFETASAVSKCYAQSG